MLQSWSKWLIKERIASSYRQVDFRLKKTIHPLQNEYNRKQQIDKLGYKSNPKKEKEKKKNQTRLQSAIAKIILSKLSSFPIILARSSNSKHPFPIIDQTTADALQTSAFYLS